jgi:hypothetical protein
MEICLQNYNFARFRSLKTQIKVLKYIFFDSFKRMGFSVGHKII